MKIITKEEVSRLMDLHFEGELESGESYLAPTEKGYVAVDNTSGDFFTEDFGTEAEAKLYLGQEVNKSDLIISVTHKSEKEYQSFIEEIKKQDITDILLNNLKITVYTEVNEHLQDSIFLQEFSDYELEALLAFDTSILGRAWLNFLETEEIDLRKENIRGLLFETMTV